MPALPSVRYLPSVVSCLALSSCTEAFGASLGLPRVVVGSDGCCRSHIIIIELDLSLPRNASYTRACTHLVACSNALSHDVPRTIGLAAFVQTLSTCSDACTTSSVYLLFPLVFYRIGLLRLVPPTRFQTPSSRTVPSTYLRFSDH